MVRIQNFEAFLRKLKEEKEKLSKAQHLNSHNSERLLIYARVNVKMKKSFKAAENEILKYYSKEAIRIL